MGKIATNTVLLFSLDQFHVGFLFHIRKMANKEQRWKEPCILVDIPIVFDWPSRIAYVTMNLKWIPLQRKDEIITQHYYQSEWIYFDDKKKAYAIIITDYLINALEYLTFNCCIKFNTFFDHDKRLRNQTQYKCWLKLMAFSALTFSFGSILSLFSSFFIHFRLLFNV